MGIASAGTVVAKMSLQTLVQAAEAGTLDEGGQERIKLAYRRVGEQLR